MNRTDELKNKLKNEQKHSFESLRELVEVLRSEGGCPWDREQTHASIRADIIEETYEVIEAIDNSDPVLLREELGDVMFQVMFHSRIEEEDGRFTVEDVVHDICEKRDSQQRFVDSVLDAFVAVSEQITEPLRLIAFDFLDLFLNLVDFFLSAVHGENVVLLHEMPLVAIQPFQLGFFSFKSGHCFF